MAQQKTALSSGAVQIPQPRILVLTKKYHEVCAILEKAGLAAERLKSQPFPSDSCHHFSSGILVTDLQLPFQIPGLEQVCISKIAFNAPCIWRVDPSRIEYELLPVVEKASRILALESENSALRAALAVSSELFEGVVTSFLRGTELHCRSGFGHGRRTELYSVGLAREALLRSTIVGLEEGDIEAIRYAARLHDVGKVVIDIKVHSKETRLSYAQIQRIRSRFRDAENLLHNKGAPQERITELDNLFNLIYKVNQLAELSDETVEKLRAAMGARWKDHTGRKRVLLTPGEFVALSVKKGNLLPREWEEMKAHPVYSEHLLGFIPWPGHLAAVPHLAGLHHELLDGSGYPYGMRSQDIPPSARIICIADKFDALTASNREYKKPYSSREALAILQTEAEGGKIDAALLAVFMESRVLSSIQPD